jgi:hypothetical protein
MKKYIFGFDADHPENCARRLRAQGMDAVVLGDADERTEDALANAGLELYLCYGAYGLKSNAPATAQTATGKPVRWFSSGCPNDGKAAGRNMDAMLKTARRLKTLRGIFVDGARFASFASTEGRDVFFTCFCPKCMKKMTDRGLDAKAVRASAARFMATKKIFERDRENLTAWMDFRAACVQDYFERFAKSVHALRGDLLAGAFVFAPSLGRFVGQTAEACRPLDAVAPMLYRAYPHEDGPACLGHEWAGLKALLGESAEEFVNLTAPGIAVPAGTPESLLTEGFTPERVAEEVALAKKSLAPSQQLWPILQIEDAALTETTRLALESGADAAGYFMFGQADLP